MQFHPKGFFMQNSQDQECNLLEQGYIKLDLDTGLAKNGKIICLVTEAEKYILKVIRDAFKGELPKSYNLELKISETSPPIKFNFTKQ